MPKKRRSLLRMRWPYSSSRTPAPSKPPAGFDMEVSPKPAAGGIAMMMSRRTFTSMLAASLTAALIPTVARAGNRPEARNVVLVHGLFADGSSWSEVIPRLQAAGLNVTSVQNPLTTLEDAVAETQRVLSRQDGPTVLAAHSFAGMIATEA